MGKPKTKRPSSTTTSNVTFRCHPVDREAIARAAEKAGKDASEYCRDVMIDYAYSDLGERRPNLPPVGRDVRKRMLEEAAKRAGKTVRKYMLELAQKQAAVDLGFDASIGEGSPIQPRSRQRELFAPPRLEPPTAVSPVRRRTRRS